MSQPAPTRRQNRESSERLLVFSDARAFAAELLAPAEGIRARLGVGMGGITAAPVIADAYAVSETVIQHQIENQI
jgi:Zn-dependent peptidase ImmA (M78 family)